MSDLFLGVDGGQSSTTALIGDSHGKTLGWGTAGPCNHVSAVEARVKFTRVMRECIGKAAEVADIAADLPSIHFRAACFGLSGGPDEKDTIVRELIRADRLIVTHDARIALAGATSGQPGVVVISGTGSVAYGENAGGETARTGGWGYIFGDEGSGFDIARRAVRACLREFEGWGGRTALTPALLEATGTADANELVHLLYTPEWPRSRTATLAQTVDRIATEADPIAISILHDSAKQLAGLARTTRDRLFAEHDSVRISWIGGVFQSGILRARFQTLISATGGVICAPPVHGPAQGALLLAWRTASVSVLPGVPESL